MQNKFSFIKNARKNTFNRWGMVMQIILIKLTLYVTEKMHRKCTKKETIDKKFKGFMFCPVKVKTPPPKQKKIKQYPSRTCCKHSRPLLYYYWPVIAVLQQCTDGLATVWTLILRSRLISSCTVCPDDLYENLGF